MQLGVFEELYKLVVQDHTALYVKKYINSIYTITDLTFTVGSIIA
jgi:hypothetical protein